MNGATLQEFQLCWKQTQLEMLLGSSFESNGSVELVH